MGSRQPKNRIDSPIGAPCFFNAARSSRNPRNGATPVPGPIMIIGRGGVSGGGKGVVGLRREAGTGGEADCAAGGVAQTPRDAARPLSAAPSQPPPGVLPTQPG